MKIHQTESFKATVGLDWADKKHDLWIGASDASKAEHIILDHTPEELHGWVAKMKERFQSGRIAIAVETSRGPVISALMAYDFIVLFPVNPKALKDYRAAFSVSGAKDDRTDSQLLEELVRLHRDKLKGLEPDTEQTRKIGAMVEDRRHLVDERTRVVNQLHARLKTYYPLAEVLLNGQMNSLMAAEFLSRWPDFKAITGEDPEKIISFFHKHNSRNDKKIQQRLETIKKARALTTDGAIVEPARQMVVAMASVLKTLCKSIEKLEKTIANVFDQHPEAELFRSLPGAGPALAPRLLAAFGTNRQRFESAAEVAQFYGIAPVVIQSGQSKITRTRHRCPKFGRQTFHENASCASKTEAWAKAYYSQQKVRNHDKHHQACRALAFKLIRIYFSCWKNKTPYKSSTYLEALKRNCSPLHKQIQNPGE